MVAACFLQKVRESVQMGDVTNTQTISKLQLEDTPSQALENPSHKAKTPPRQAVLVPLITEV